MRLVKQGKQVISIHAPPRGATLSFLGAASPKQNFNSRPSARGDAHESRCLQSSNISIHAPPRGATQNYSKLYGAWKISIHAPPRGATTARRGSPGGFPYFNSRPSARGDERRRRQWKPLRQFQFTPLREGRLGWPRSTILIPSYFNSRPSARGDLIPLLMFRRGAAHFNSRPSARGDGHILMGARERQIDFNSRPSARGDAFCVAFRVASTYFNSRPSARGDMMRHRLRLPPSYFNSRPSARGDDGCGMCDGKGACISIHAPPRGATERGRLFGGEAVLFQFTPLREGRPCRFACCFLAFCISIHAPPRGATQ